jgi:hypothetical protein
VSGDPYLAELAARGYRDEDAERFVCAWERVEGAYFASIATVIVPSDGWRDRFRAAAMETARLVESHRAEARFLVVDAMAAGELGRERQQALAERLALWLDSAREELDEPSSVPPVTGGWIVAVFFDRVYRRCVFDATPDLPSQLPELMFLAVSAYFGTEAGLHELTRLA